MKKNISTIQRFLLPVAILIIASALILAEQETSQQMRTIEEEAHSQSAALIRLLNVTESLVTERVSSALNLLQERGEVLGSPAINGNVSIGDKIVPNLVLGQESQANHYELVDGVTQLLGGTATLFVKSGDEFVRVSTNVRKSDGSRAIGTILDPQGKALAAIRQNKPFYGVVDILGEPYITGYEPMRNKHGELIGLWYVGYKVDMQVLREAIEGTRHLKTGFSAVLDYKGKIRFLSAHISREEVENILKNERSEWAVISDNIPSWGFKVLVAYPKREAQLAGLTKSLYALTVGGLFAVILIIMLVSQLSRLVLRPLGGDPAVATELVQRISTGDLHDDSLQAEEGTLMANMLKMRGNLREMVDTLRQNADRLSLSASVFEHTHDGIFITDNNKHIIEVNPAFTQLTGYSREEALGRTPQRLKFSVHDHDLFQRLWNHPENPGEWCGEIWNERKDGTEYPVWLDLFAVHNSAQGISNYVGVCSDLTLLKQQQQNLERMAYHDPLTQLPNRTLFFDAMQQTLARAQRSKELLAICYLDLDDFKPVNDTLGHEAGDQLLIELAQRIRSCVRAGDTVARLGGDEFALILCALQSTEECKQTLDRLLASIIKPYQIAGKVISVSVSIGYTFFPFDDANPDQLLHHADQAMYSAKLRGGNTHHLFDAGNDALITK
jgi:diguanylate cyclase (GGDEF)-like protein/PAS domain S-box-containing protein